MATDHCILAVIISIFSKPSKLLNILQERANRQPNFPLLQSLLQVCRSIEEQKWEEIQDSPEFKSVQSHIQGNLEGQNENINVIVRLTLSSILYQSAPIKLKHQPPFYTLQLPLDTKAGNGVPIQQLEDALKVFEFETFPEPALLLTLKRGQEAEEKLLPNLEITIEINQGLKHDYELAAVVCKTNAKDCFQVYLRGDNWIKVFIPEAGNVIMEIIGFDLVQTLKEFQTADLGDTELMNQEVKQIVEESVFIVYAPVGDIDSEPTTSQLTTTQIRSQAPTNSSSRLGSPKGVEGRQEMSLFSNLLMSLLFVKCPASVEFLKQVEEYSSIEISREITMLSTAISNPPYFYRAAGTRRIYNILVEKSPKLVESSNFFVNNLLSETLGLPGNCVHQIVSRPKPRNRQVRTLLSTALEESFRIQNFMLENIPEPFLILKAPRIGHKLVGYESLVPTFILNLTNFIEPGNRQQGHLELHAVICQLEGLDDYVSFIKDGSTSGNWFYCDSAKPDVKVFPNFKQMVLKESILAVTQMTVPMKRLFGNPFVYFYRKRNPANPSLGGRTVNVDDKQSGLEQLKILAIQRRQTLERVLATTRVLVSTMKFECSICRNEIDPGEGVILKSCFHLFCRFCVIQTIQFSEDPKVKCPYFGDDKLCSALVTQVEIRTLLSKEMYRKYNQLSWRLAEGAMGNKAFHCKTPDCAGWCVTDNEAQIAFQCYVCGIENCITCKIQHPGVTCDDYRNQIVQNENEMLSEEAIRDAIARGEAMPCPSCGITVVKDGGCDAIICQNCKLDICWATKGPRWGPAGVGDRSGGCGCDRANGRNCTPNCGNCH